MKNQPRIIIAGMGSGCGKTTVTAAILSALTGRGIDVAPFKCGPDYIDPMFHGRITKRDSGNLDSFMLSRETLRYLFAKNCRGADLSVIEGAMGYYDGISFDGLSGSTADISQITETPSVLVVGAKGMGLSAVALIKGYIEFSPHSNIKAVIFNGIGEKVYLKLKQAVEEKLNIKVLGWLPPMPECSLESRYLGLVTAGEAPKLDEKVRKLGETANKTIDLDLLMKIAEDTKPIEATAPFEIRKPNDKFRLGVALDKAFCFYYRDNIDLLESLGAEIVPFSPMNDGNVPENIDGFYFGGGYPELYADRLAGNTAMRKSVSGCISGGMPTVAECGGFMYLCKSIERDKRKFEMCGLIDSDVKMTENLRHFGYVSLTAKKDGFLTKKGETLRGHEYHYSESSGDGDGFIIERPSGEKRDGIFETENLFAGYPHIHFWSNPDFAVRFADKCLKYKRRNAKK